MLHRVPEHRVESERQFSQAQATFAQDTIRENLSIVMGIMLEVEKDELIHTENSYKYTIPKIKEMFSSTDFRIRDMWFDQKQYFCLVLLSKND